MRMGKKMSLWLLAALLLAAPAPGKAAEILAPETAPAGEAAFRDLRSINPDVVGWLEAGSSIREPVLQLDHDYYLTHNIYREEDKAGAVFAYEGCSLCPRDPVVVLYGHNMRDGSMFGTLSEYRTMRGVRKNPLISFWTIWEEMPSCYVPVAGFHASMNETDEDYFSLLALFAADEGESPEEIYYLNESRESEVYYWNESREGEVYYSDPEDGGAEGSLPGRSAEAEPEKRQRERYAAYLEEIRERSLWESPADVNTGDELLVLVTCSYVQDNGRFMLFCRKLRDGENEEEMRALFSA